MKKENFCIHSLNFYAKCKLNCWIEVFKNNRKGSEK